MSISVPNQTSQTGWPIALSAKNSTINNSSIQLVQDSNNTFVISRSYINNPTTLTPNKNSSIKQLNTSQKNNLISRHNKRSKRTIQQPKKENRAGSINTKNLSKHHKGSSNQLRMPNLKEWIKNFEGLNKENLHLQTIKAISKMYGNKLRKNSEEYKKIYTAIYHSIIKSASEDYCKGLDCNPKKIIFYGKNNVGFEPTEYKIKNDDENINKNIKQLEYPLFYSQKHHKNKKNKDFHISFQNKSFHIHKKGQSNQNENIKKLSESISNGDIKNFGKITDDLIKKDKARFSEWLHHQFILCKFNLGSSPLPKNFANARLYLDVKPEFRGIIMAILISKINKLNNTYKKQSLTPRCESLKVANESSLSRNDNLVIYFHTNKENPINGARHILEIIADIQNDPKFKHAFRQSKSSPLPYLTTAPKSSRQLTGVRLAPNINGQSVNGMIANAITKTMHNEEATAKDIENTIDKTIQNIYKKGFDINIIKH